jgi:Nuclease-related domain
MILKKSDDKKSSIDELENLKAEAPEGIKAKIQKELNMLRAGIKGEEESCYHIDFNLRDSKNFIVIHDLRLEVKGKVAQIDHILINRLLHVYSLESKHFNSGIKINDAGEFIQWNSYKKVYEGIPSPLAQNQRHIDVLKEAFRLFISMPTRLGFSLAPNFESRVLLNNAAIINRPKNFDSSELMKSEQFFESIQKDIDNAGIQSLAKVVSSETIEDIGRQLVSLHRPIKMNYRAKFGLDKKTDSDSIEKISLSAKTVQLEKPIIVEIEPQETTFNCKKCQSKNLKIQYGKFGYYFKCSECDGNTNIKISCGKDGHNEKLRKDGDSFFRECAECKSSSLFFNNS